MQPSSRSRRACLQRLASFSAASALGVVGSAQARPRIASSINASPSTVDSFSSIIGATTPSVAYTFGTSAAPNPGEIAIRNLSDLGANFNPYSDSLGAASINSELETYQPFNATNHAFASDRLNLTAALPSQSWNGFVTVGGAAGFNTGGTANPISSMGLSSTSGLRIGQLVAVQYQGIYYISALVTNTSVTLKPLDGSPSTTQTGQLILWTPIDSAVLSAAASNAQPVLRFASAPSGSSAGAAVGILTSAGVCRSGDYRVASRSGGTVTLNMNQMQGALTAGTRVVFMQPITSGQIWTRQQFPVVSSDSFVAMELECEVLGGSRDYPIRNISTISKYNAAPADVPWGAWPAFWTCSGNDQTYRPSDASEIDIMEMYWSTTSGPTVYTGYNHGPGLGSSTYEKSDGGWMTRPGINVAPTSLAGPRKFQLVFTKNATWKYVDGVLIKAASFQWTSQEPIQAGINLAIGSLSRAFASNLMLPIQAANFAGQTMGVKSLKVWQS